MKSTAISAQGTKLYVSDEKFVIDGSLAKAIAGKAEVNNLRSFKGFDGQATEVDITNLSSEAKEYRLGLPDNGNLVIDLDRDFDDEGQGELHVAREESEMRHFLLVFPNKVVAAKFDGFVKNSPLEGGVDQVIKSTGVTIRITGPVEFLEFEESENT
ncbi:hypothetical protein G3N95_34955 [Paraburkholderia sp. Tr-20389]|uniref:phage tail tube protein n=1 Tax=Paraburkholderia sp. Tr-20389 TaxID=2703903 RepID=UPI00197E288B|nr:hypothetical protein [Paraburkholderia sp. Tr-20389]MBN3758160.1 hypothetical protein [Paraburkholderia sp. Tr-20389]